MPLSSNNVVEVQRPWALNKARSREGCGYGPIEHDGMDLVLQSIRFKTLMEDGA